MRRAPKLLRTTAFQLTLLYTLIFTLSVLTILGFIYWSTIGFLERQTDATIEAEITGLAEQYRQRGLEGLARVVSDRIERAPLGRSVYLFADADGRALGGNLSRWPALRAAASPEANWVAFSYANERGDDIAVRARVFTFRGDIRLLVGRDIRELQRIRSVFNQAVTWGGSATLALALAGGLFLSTRVRKRIEIISDTAMRIMHGELSQRVATRGTGDEFDELATNLNAMLDRIESLMGGVRHVADSIAHDLRTPLTRLRNRLEQLSLAGDEDSELVEQCVADADNLLQTFQALLRIARIESGGHTREFTPVELRTVLDDAYELYSVMAEQKQIGFSVAASAIGRVMGDRDLLFQGVVNLLDNAVKYTPEGGRIDLTLHESDAGMAVITVSDTGPGIALEMRQKVLERFFRLDQARNEPGSGLGLSLVSAVAELHSGDLLLDDAQPGLRVVWTVPLVRPAT